MKRVKGYDCKVIVAHVPTLDEAQRHYKETGEFLISSLNDTDPAFDGDDVNTALENAGITSVDKVDLGIKEADSRNIIQHTPKPVAAPVAPADPVLPSE